VSFAAALLATVLLWIGLWLPARLAAARWLGRFEALERLCLSVGFGALGIHVCWMLALLAGWRGERCLVPAVGTWGVLTVAALAWSGRKGVSILPDHAETLWGLRTLAIPVWMLLLAWTQSTLYGGGWSGDWNEHYRRALYFLGRLPAGEALEFGVTDRPPLFNVVSAAWAAFLGTRFSDYQILSLTLSSTAALPCLLLLRRLTGQALERPRDVAFLVFVYVLHPTIAANTVYTWTRMLAVFFVLSAAYFYVAFACDHRGEALAPAFLAAGLGVATHYSALVPAALIAVHWLLRRRRAVPPATAALAVAAGVVPSLLWLAWAVRGFGWRATLGSNTTVANYAKEGTGVLGQWGYNLMTTLVPFWDWAAARPYVLQAYAPGAWSDALHLYWVSTLVGAVSTSLLVACLVVAALRLGGAVAPGFRSGESRALLTASLVVFVASFPTIPNAEVAGFVHLALQPAVILVFLVGVAWIVSKGRAPRRLFVLLFGAEGLLFYVLKTFDRRSVPTADLGFGYRVNRGIQESHHLALLYDRDPSFALLARVALIVGVVVLAAACYSLSDATTPDDGARRGA
jgi:hypothetical protein